jgi:hypothetical protein
MTITLHTADETKLRDAAPALAEALRAINLVLLPDSPSGHISGESVRRARVLAYDALREAGVL